MNGATSRVANHHIFGPLHLWNFDFHKDTPWKFNSSPLKNKPSGKENISSSNHHFFKGELLNFGQV